MSVRYIHSLKFRLLVLAAVACWSGLASPAKAQRPEQILEGALSGAVERAMLHELRDLRSEFSNNWGKTVRAAAGTTTERYKIYGPRNPITGERGWTWGYRPVVKYEEKNHGEWTRGWVKMENAANELDVKLRNFKKTPGKLELRFQVYARAMFRGQTEFKSYSHGAHLASATANGRARGEIELNMRVYLFENATRLGWEVESADIKYSDVVLDRVGHVGGQAAKLMGDAFTGAIKKWFADKEKEAIDKAKNAISNTFKGEQKIRSEIARVIKMF